MARRLLPLVILLLGLMAAIGATLWVSGGFGPASRPSAIGGPFNLIDEHNSPVTQAAFANKVALIFFGYTHCPDVCPTTLYDLSQVLEKVPASAPLTAAFITVDPERDTPALMKDYLSSFDPRIHAFSGPRPEIEAAMRAYRVYAKKVPGSRPDDYTYDHTAMVYLMDRQGNFVTGLDLKRPPQETAQLLASYF